MAKKILIAFDMDDTFTDTRHEIVHDLLYRLDNKGLTKELDYVLKNHHMTPLLWTKEMCGIVFEHSVKFGYFMWDAKPTSLITEHKLIEFMRALLANNWGPYITSVVCTHRGFHTWGHSGTSDWLVKHAVDDVIHEVHALDPKVHPNKLDFLRKQYPEYEILLLDDNPFHDPHTVHPHSDEVLVYEGVHSLPGYVNQDKFTTIEDLRDRIIKKMFGERGYNKLLQQYASIP